MWEHLPARWQDLTRSDSGMDNLVSLYQWHFDLSNELPWSCSYVFLLLINFFYNFAGKNTHGDELYACLWFSWSFFKVAMEIWSPWTFVTLSGKAHGQQEGTYIEIKYLLCFWFLCFWLNDLIWLYRQLISLQLVLRERIKEPICYL